MQFPEITNYTMVNRTYRYYTGEALFPFGYGLYVMILSAYTFLTLFLHRSYTTFKYSNLSVSPATVKADQSVTVSATVSNSGNTASDEVCCSRPLATSWADSVFVVTPF